MNLFKSIITLSMISMLFLFSCSDTATNKDNGDIPDNAVEFPDGKTAAEFAITTLDGVGNFAASALDPIFDNSTKKPTATTGDSLYYQNDWWYYSASTYYSGGQGGTGFSMEINNKYQFSKNGSTQKEWGTADKVNAVVDVEGNFSMEGSSMDLKYFFDLTFSNINSTMLAVLVNGDGYYDFLIESTIDEQTEEYRYYIKYKFEELALPEDDYPTGVLVVETKKYKVNMTFNGTNMVAIVVTQDGTTVYTTQYDMDEGE